MPHSLAPTPKPFAELTKDEATAIAKEVVRSSDSEQEIRRRLTEAGFDGRAAAVHSHRSGPMFQAMVMVFGPRGEVISV